MNVAFVNGGEKIVSTMALTEDQINDTDAQILDYLHDDGRASPTLFQRAEDIDTSRQYVSSRFVRLAEHGHIRELYDTGIYEFVSHPGENGDDSTRKS